MKAADWQQQASEARRLLLGQKFAQALVQYESLTRRYPAEAVLWLEYGNAAAGLRRRDLADKAWQQAQKLAPSNAELLGVLGHQYRAQRRPDRAQACFAQAVAVAPADINPRISLAVLLEQQHRVADARIAVEECLALNPTDDQGRYFSAVLDRREGKLESAERRLRDLLRSEPKHPYVRYACRYELAQILDATERFEEAMRCLTEAKSLVRRLTDTAQLVKAYDLSAESNRRFTFGLPQDVLVTWGKLFPERAREPVPRLAFLGGHPRSGTTLLEQVLDAHPEVAALDEPDAFLSVLQPEFHKSKQLSCPRLNSLRRLYVAALLEEAGPAAVDKLLVDKNPSPTARLAVWLRVFPELRVIIAVRDPRDVVLSCYFQNLPLNSTNVNFLSFERLAKHYGDLMSIWLGVRNWRGLAWIETRYEDAVANLETEGRRITEFLGLPWRENQTNFHETSLQKQLYSPTYQDVTRPLYKRSVGRWKNYEPYLAPIMPALEPYCQQFGYS